MTFSLLLIASKQPANEYNGGPVGENDSEWFWMQKLVEQIGARLASTSIVTRVAPAGDQNSDGLRTYRDNVVWANKAYDELRALGLEVRALLDFHSNASGDATILFGTSVASAELASKFLAELNSHNMMPFGDTWDLNARKVSELVDTKPPAVLFEMGRHDVDEYAAWLRASINNGTLADWMVKRICAVFGVSAPSAPVVPPLVVQKPVGLTPFDWPLDDGCHSHGRDAYFGPKFPLSNLRSVSGYYNHRDDLRHWQTRMKERGWRIDITGYYSDDTKRVALAFQKEKGLDVDGLIGKQTWNAAWTEPVT